MMDFEILVITLVMILLDLIFGFIGAVKEKIVSSTKLRDGLWHKSGFIGLIALAYILQIAIMKVDLGFEIPTVIAVCVYIIVTEAVSIVENLCILNPNIIHSPFGEIFHNVPKIEKAEKLEKEDKDNDV